MNTLIIGDLHAPFTKEGYLAFCKSVYKKYKCKQVVFLGDIIDNHASSFHESDPDGYSAGMELDEAIKEVRKWYKAFPKAKVCAGNHDRVVNRKAMSGGLSQMWIKDYSDVLGTPNWEFAESFNIDGVRYEHGEGGRVEKKMLERRESIVQGHRHSEAYTKWSVSDYDRLFAMQVGWGGDQSAYSMAYAKNFRAGVVSCAVIAEGLPILIPMPLNPKKRR